VRSILISLSVCIGATAVLNGSLRLRLGSGLLLASRLVLGQLVCPSLSASLSLESLDRSSRNSVCRSPVAVALSSSGGVANLRNVIYFRLCDMDDVTLAAFDLYECLVFVFAAPFPRVTPVYRYNDGSATAIRRHYEPIVRYAPLYSPSDDDYRTPITGL